MKIFERIACRLSYTRKGRKIATNIVTIVFISFALLTGSLLSVLAASYERSAADFSNVDLITNSEIFEASHLASTPEIPIVDSNDIKIIKTYPWPSDGILTSGYGWRILDGKREFHGGIDISTGGNNPVISIADGQIECIGIDEKGYGLYIIISHDDGFQTLSAHLAESYVKEGDRVVQGQIIGLEGGGSEDPYPGRSTGRHLHFEVRKSDDTNSRIDPMIIFSN